MIVPRALPKVMHAALQVHHQTVLSHHGAVLGADYRTTAGRQDNVVLFEQFLNHAALARTESSLALDIENVRDGHAGTPLDLFIAVDESLAELLGKQLPHRGFACAHHSDQNDSARRPPVLYCVAHARDCIGNLAFAFCQKEKARLCRASLLNTACS